MILISEVGPREGLQSIDRVMPLEAKKAWIAAEAAAGVREIEVGSERNSPVSGSIHVNATSRVTESSKSV